MLHRRAVQQEQPPSRFSPGPRVPPQPCDTVHFSPPDITPFPPRDTVHSPPPDTAHFSPRDTACFPPRDTALRCHVMVPAIIGCARSAGMDDDLLNRGRYTTCTQFTAGVRVCCGLSGKRLLLPQAQRTRFGKGPCHAGKERPPCLLYSHIAI